MQRPIIVRQPVLNRDKEVIAYELLYQNNQDETSESANYEFTAGKINEDFKFVKDNNLSDGKKIFIKFDKNLFEGEISELISKDQIGVEISYQIEEDIIIEAIKKLKSNGSLIILDKVKLNSIAQRMIKLADIVKIDFKKFNPKKHQALIHFLKENHNSDLSFLAENINDYEDYNSAAEAGYDYFQGNFFTKPDVLRKGTVPGYKINYLKFLKEINKEDFDFEKLEEIIKNDMSMSVSLLRMINSAYYGYKVSSIRQASTLLGIKGLKKWSVVYLVEGLQNDKPDILFVNTLTRAKFAESLAESFNFKDYKGELFTMGMLSMIDAFMDQPLVRVLKEVPFSFLQSRALLFEKGKFGDVLKLVKAFEDVEWDKIKRIQKKYKLEAEKTYNKYLESVDFAYETMNVLLSEV